jgi:hypothetical protein
VLGLDLAAPVIGIGVEHDLVVLRPRHEAYGAGSHGLGVERLGSRCLQIFPGHDLAAIEGQARGKQWIGLLRGDDEGHGVGGLDLLDGAERGGDHGLGAGIVGSLDAELGVG